MAENGEEATRILVLISGNGSNLQALIDACNTPRLPFSTIIRVISNRKDAYGLIRAQNASIPTAYHNLVKYKKQQAATDEGVRLAREAYDQDLAQLILDAHPLFQLRGCLGESSGRDYQLTPCLTWTVQWGWCDSSGICCVPEWSNRPHRGYDTSCYQRGRYGGAHSNKEAASGERRIRR
jgi:Formyl transferase